ncbi:hypothetical protein GBAR_LOCUS7913 [Geodia barretti]|uniref:Uncharacterized protein n=1 Tax=Geodia barretti TaxID=519541 RepID=A0AA35RIT2_GEOBA|nr:hypothetical protein GBAR_LOCUS7913 [Geodia barretti]
MPCRFECREGCVCPSLSVWYFGLAVSLICWALWPCGCQSDMLGFVAVRLSVLYVGLMWLYGCSVHNIYSYALLLIVLSSITCF